jgi:hypothetical protein
MHRNAWQHSALWHLNCADGVTAASTPRHRATDLAAGSRRCGLEHEHDPGRRDGVIDRPTSRVALPARSRRQQRLDPLPQPVGHEFVDQPPQARHDQGAPVPGAPVSSSNDALQDVPVGGSWPPGPAVHLRPGRWDRRLDQHPRLVTDQPRRRGRRRGRHALHPPPSRSGRRDRRTYFRNVFFSGPLTDT